MTDDRNLLNEAMQRGDGAYGHNAHQEWPLKRATEQPFNEQRDQLGFTIGDKWNPATHPYRVTEYWNTSIYGLHGWNDKVHGMFTTEAAAREYADAQPLTRPGSHIDIDVVAGKRWKRITSRKRTPKSGKN